MRINQIKSLVYLLLGYNIMYIIVFFSFISQKGGCKSLIAIMIFYSCFLALVTLFNLYHTMKGDFLSLKRTSYTFIFVFSVFLVISFIILIKPSICDDYNSFNFNTGFCFIQIFNIPLTGIIQSQIEPELRVVPLPNIQQRIKGKKISLLEEDWECPICFEKEVKEKEVYLLECSHSFHLDCLNKCLENNISKCPMCRIEMV